MLFDMFGNGLSPATLWILAGIVMVLVEFAIPGVITVFFGASAIIVGILLGLGVVMVRSTQFLVFGGLGVALLFVLRARISRWFVGDTDDSSAGVALFSPGDTVEAVASFTDGRGKVRLRGAEWQAELAEGNLPVTPGQRLWITGHSGLVLHVRSTNPKLSQ